MLPCKGSSDLGSSRCWSPDKTCRTWWSPSLVSAHWLLAAGLIGPFAARLNVGRQGESTQARGQAAGAEQPAGWYRGVGLTAGWGHGAQQVRRRRLIWCGQALGRQTPHQQPVSEEQIAVAGPLGTLQQRWEEIPQQDRSGVGVSSGWQVSSCLSALSSELVCLYSPLWTAAHYPRSFSSVSVYSSLHNNI